MSALLAGYYALGLGPGDEVIVGDLGFLASVSPLFVLGIVPVLADAGEDSGNVTPATVAARIIERTRAIAITHPFGYSVNLAGLRALAALHGLAVLEDCSHAHGATCDFASLVARNLGR